MTLLVAEGGPSFHSVSPLDESTGCEGETGGAISVRGGVSFWDVGEGGASYSVLYPYYSLQ